MRAPEKKNLAAVVQGDAGVAFRLGLRFTIRSAIPAKVIAVLLGMAWVM